MPSKKLLARQARHPAQGIPASSMKGLHRILVVRLDNIGDMVMLGPTLYSLRAALPKAHISLLASPAGAQAAPLLPWVDEVIPWRAMWQELGSKHQPDPERELELVERLRQGAFDAALIFTSFSQSPYLPAYACYLAGIPLRAGLSHEFGGQALSHWFQPPPEEGHQVDRNLALLENLNIPVAGQQLELVVPSADQARARELLRASGLNPADSFIVLAPGASCSARRYDPMRYAVVARQLSEAFGLKIVVVGSAREAELLAPITSIDHPNLFSLVGKTTISELAGVISRSSLVITNNSSSLHIADAFRIPMVILYSGTEYTSQWQPRTSVNRLLKVDTECSPCYSFQCPYSMECLDIDPISVVRSALELMPRLEVERSIKRAASQSAARLSGAEQPWRPV